MRDTAAFFVGCLVVVGRLVSGFSQASVFEDKVVSGWAARCGTHDSTERGMMNGQVSSRLDYGSAVASAGG